MFIPDRFIIPSGLQTEELILEPLRASHVEVDFDAVVSSQPMLRRWSQSSWPDDDFTLDDNLEDLARHESEHLEREAFTYTVLNPHKTECLGCVYIVPLPPHIDTVPGDECVSLTRFWVRQSRLADDLDRRLLTYVIEWFENDWRFDRAYIGAAREDSRQLDIFSLAGLLPSPDIELQPGSDAWAAYLV